MCAKMHSRYSYIEVLGVNVAMLGEVVVLLGHEHTLSEEVLVDLFAVCLGDKPLQRISTNSRERGSSLTLLRVPGAIRGIALQCACFGRSNSEVDWPSTVLESQWTQDCPKPLVQSNVTWGGRADAKTSPLSLSDSREHSHVLKVLQDVFISSDHQLTTTLISRETAIAPFFTSKWTPTQSMSSSPRFPVCRCLRQPPSR